MAESVDRNTIQGNASGEYDFEAMLEAALKESGQGQLPPPPPPPQTEHQTLPQPQQQQAQPQPPAATPGTAPAPTAQEQQDLGFDPSILEQPLAQRLQNRNFKVKVHAAKCIVEKIKEGVFPPEKAELEGLVKMTSDSAPLSQEAGLTTLDFIFATALNDSTTEHAKTEALLGTKEALKVDVLATSLIEKCLGNARPKPREQGLTVLLYLVQIDEQEVVTEALVKGTKNRVPKVVLGSIFGARSILSEFGPRQFPVDKFVDLFEAWFSHRDSEVRKEAQNFLVELYRWNEGGQKEMVQLIAPLKPAQKKDIEEAFAQVTEFKSAPKRLTWTAQKAKEAEEAEKKKKKNGEKKDGNGSGAGPGASGQPLRLGKPINLLKEIDPVKFYDTLGSGKWTEKRDELQHVIDKLNTGSFLDPQGDYSALINALRVGLSEVNLVVRVKCAEALGLMAARMHETFAPYARTIILALLLSFKEKKPHYVAAVQNALDQIVESSVCFLKVYDDIVQACTNKTPSIPIQTLTFLHRSITNGAKTCSAQIEASVAKICAPFATTITHENSDVRELTGKCINALQEIVPEEKIAAALKGTSDAKRLEKVLARSSRGSAKEVPVTTASTVAATQPSQQKQNSAATTATSPIATPSKQQQQQQQPSTLASSSSSSSSKRQTETITTSSTQKQQVQPVPASKKTASQQPVSPPPSTSPVRRKESVRGPIISSSSSNKTSSMTPPPSEREKALTADPGPYSLTAKAPRSVIQNIDSSDWSVRQEALTELARIIRVECFGTIKPAIGTLQNSLKARLTDSNKGVVRAALSVLGEMAQAIKKPGFEKLAKFFYPTVLQILGDGAKQNRDDALRCSQAFAANASLSTTLSAAAAALTGEKDSAALRREVLTFLNEHMAAGTPQEFAAAGDGLQSLIRPVLVCVLDRQGDVRKLADAAVAVIAKYVAYASFEPHLEKYNPAQKDALAKVLAKYYKAPTTTTAPLTPSSELKAAKRTSSRLPSSRQSAPSTPTKSAAESTAKSPRKREPARTAQLGLLLVDPARKLERSKVAAFYDPKVLGAVAGRQSLRDYLKSGPLAEPAAAAQMFSLDPAVLAQALTEFTALVAKNPAAAASSSDLLIVWCVTAVMGDADDSVATKSCALLTKVLEVLVERDETLLGHEVFAIVHGLPRYLTHRVDLKEPVELLARLCAPSPFLPIKYATDALNAGGESCVPLLEALDLLVVACPRSLLDYSEHPGLVRLVSQYALSEDASVSTPARAVLAHLYAAGVGEQLFAYVPSDKAAAIRGIVAVSNALTPSEPALLEFTEEGLEEAGCAIEQARKAKDLGRLAREAAALQRLLASATTTSGSTQPPPPPHVYEAEGLLTALARVVPIMLRDPQIEVPMVGAVCALNACLKRGYIDVQGLSQGCVDMLVHALLLRRNSELHRTLVVLFKLGNPFRIAVALVRLAQNSIISGGGGGGGTEALELLDEAALLCAKATDPERDGLRSLLSTLNDALTDSMMHEQPPYEVAKACVRTLKTLHSGPNRALTEKLCRNVDMGSATLTTFLYDSFDNDDDTAAAADEEGNCMNNNNSNSNNNNSVRNSNDDDSNEIERPHTPLGQSH